MSANVIKMAINVAIPMHVQTISSLKSVVDLPGEDRTIYNNLIMVLNEKTKLSDMKMRVSIYLPLK